jgi:hypothetical protein
MAERIETNNNLQSTTQKAKYGTTEKPRMNSTKPISHVKL